MITRPGTWYHITAGMWAGYWIEAGPSVRSATRQRRLRRRWSRSSIQRGSCRSRAGTHIGRQFDAAGNITASKPYTLASASSAPADQQMTMSTRPGTWYHITAGVWAGYWIEAGPGVSLGP